MNNKIGVYICHCGGNISDYVDVKKVRDTVASEEGVVLAKDTMFACADSAQKEIIEDIREKKLDAIVIASCSSKLHLYTFRDVAQRALLNKYNYVQANIREQCSWAHTSKPAEATEKAVRLVRAAINKARYTEALEPLIIPAVNAALVIGAGVSGMRAAVQLADMGTGVFLVEKNNSPGGRVATMGTLFPTGEKGKDLIAKLEDEIKKRDNIKLFTSAQLSSISGSLGNFHAKVSISGTGSEAGEESLEFDVGAVLLCTGYDNYEPQQGEYGYGEFDNIVTLPQFKQLVEECSGELQFNNRLVKDVVYIYCVGSRQEEGDNKYCSRFCCTSAIHTSILTGKKSGNINSYHLYRDIRTYGKQELLYEEASRQRDIFCKVDPDDPPKIEAAEGADSGRLSIKFKDLLYNNNEELEIIADLVVLVTGMVPAKDGKDVAAMLKAPLGSDKFLNEIHPKLRPVETVIDGVFICGTCQGPKNITESVSSALSAAAKCNALLNNEQIEREPTAIRIDQEKCEWCGKCLEICPYDCITQDEYTPGEKGGKSKTIAQVNASTCKGCGMCAPICPQDAIELIGYTDNEIESMIEGLIKEVSYAG